MYDLIWRGTVWLWNGDTIPSSLQRSSRQDTEFMWLIDISVAVVKQAFNVEMQSALTPIALNVSKSTGAVLDYLSC